MTKTAPTWFEVDKAGLAKLIQRKGRAFILHELVQNAWDTKATWVDIRLDDLGPDTWRLKVTDDDPEGFRDLAHAFTMFAESEKKSDAEKRGRFNLGEKLVLAACDSAEIMSTTGCVTFRPDGMRVQTARRLPAGSAFVGIMKMTQGEAVDLAVAAACLLPPENVRTDFNGRRLQPRKQVRAFSATLPTEVAGTDGILKKTARKTRVTIHEPLDGEEPTLYEMGIPVITLSGGERWHINVHQKIPLGVDRDNVTPAYSQALRVALANAMVDELGPEDAGRTWVTAATEDERVEREVVEKMLDHRFGEKRAIFDMADREANKELVNHGYTVITGGSLSGKQWDIIKKMELAKPSGRIRPSAVQFAREGRAEREISVGDWTEAMGAVASFTEDLSRQLLDKAVEVRIINEPVSMPYLAYYGNSTLTFNMGRLGRDWFSTQIRAEHIQLILHEFAHDKVSDHLTHEFADEVGRLGTKLVGLALKVPTFLLSRNVRL